MNQKRFCAVDGFVVKTLFLKSLAKDVRSDHLFDYFSTFGTLQSVRVHTHVAHSFGFVKFETIDGVVEVLKMRNHLIDGHNIEVEIADNCHQDEPTTNDELRIESINATGTEFMDLNDDCLRNIIARLPVMELCSLRELSQTNENIRLETIINEVFSKKYRSFTNDATITADDLDRILSNFGALIADLKMDGSNEDAADSARKIKSMIRWCSIKMHTVDLISYTFSEKATRALKKVLRSAKNFSTQYCRFAGGAMDLFDKRNKLRSLILINRIADVTGIFQHTFLRLDEFVICASDSLAINYNFENFISRHKKLESLHLLFADDMSALLPHIAENCTKLHTLEITTDGNTVSYETYVKSISTMNNLGKLSIRYDSNALTFIRELNYLQFLEKLKLKFVRFVPGLMTALLQLKMLVVLGIHDCQNLTNLDTLTELCQLKKLCILSNTFVTFDLIYMVRNLVDLEKLILNLKRFTFDDEMHSKIVAVRSKSENTKRSLEIVFNDITTHFLP